MTNKETTDFRIIAHKWHNCKCWYISLPNGRVRLESSLDGNEWCIVGLVVNPDYRRQGIAAALLDKCEEICNHNQIELWLEPDATIWLIEYYLARGYKILESCNV